MMSAASNKRKRLSVVQVPALASQPNLIHGILDAYDFLATNEYSEKTIGIQAFVTRKSVGDINFSDIIEDSEKRNKQGQTINFVGILEDKRCALAAIDASVEKCLMLNRLISYIQENETLFTKTVSDIRLEMQYNMSDNQNSIGSYDIRQREQEFERRNLAQQRRRLFFDEFPQDKQPPNLMYLQNRTTEQLTHLIEHMPRDSKSRTAHYAEIQKIFRTSFLIVTQPHSGRTPVTIYERKGPGEYTAKISVTIISLLHDYMQAHPNLIELFDIEPSLYPLSDYYKLEEPRSLPWKTCQLQTALGGKTRTFLYTELTSFTIEQASKTDTRVRFAQLLHSFKFAIKLQLNIADTKSPTIYEMTLESLPFGIGAHNNQIPQLLTRILIDDMERLSPARRCDIKNVLNYLRRYFIHRTGVEPKPVVMTYFEQELTKATNQRGNAQSIESIYWDFLVNVVHQIEFMVKHPILSMFHEDGLFLGICNSERTAEAIVQSTVSGSPIIALRFNSIRLDYNAPTMSTAGTRPVRLAPCAVRVDIYNDRNKKLQNRTFDSSILTSDISKFVSSAHTESANRIHVLSSFDDRTNEKKYLSFGEFSKYYHERLQEILKSDEKYKPVTDLVENANDGGIDEHVNVDMNANPLDNMFPFTPNSVPSVLSTTSATFEHDYLNDDNSPHEYASIPYDTTNPTIGSPQNILSPVEPVPSVSQQQPQQNHYVNSSDKFLQWASSQPKLVEKFLRQCSINNVEHSVGSPQPMQYQTPPPRYPPQTLPYQAQSFRLPAQTTSYGAQPSQYQTHQLQNPALLGQHQASLPRYQTQPVLYQTQSLENQVPPSPNQPQSLRFPAQPLLYQAQPARYQTQALQYQPSSPMVNFQQRLPAQIPIQQSMNQLPYHPQQPQVYLTQSESQMQFQQTGIKQQPHIQHDDQQRRPGSSVIHYLPNTNNNNNVPVSLPFSPPTELFQLPIVTDTTNLVKPAMNPIHDCQTMNENSNQSEHPTLFDEVSELNVDQQLEQLINFVHTNSLNEAHN